MAGGGGESELSLEFTPTWIVAIVCSVIVFISLFFERILHFLGKLLKRKKQKPLFEALQKVKEELMLLGFISLLLTVFQGAIQRTCIRESLTHHMLPCKRKEAATTAHYAVRFFSGVLGSGRRLLAGGGEDSTHCQKEGKVPLLSLEAIHQLHIFIFVLAVTHVVLSLITVLLGTAKIRIWRHWEDSIQKEDGNVPKGITHVHQFEFIRNRFKGFDKDSSVLSWLHSFVKQFFGSVTKSDYTTMRLGFIMTHCRGNPKFNFYSYMIRALEADFKRVVGISWYLWIFVMVFLLLDVNGWHAYFWISFIPLILLLALGTKLEHIITQLAHEVAEKHSAIEGDLVVTPSDDLFWFHRPKIVLFLIHFILFQNAFEIAFFFWVLTTYNFDSCIMGQAGFIIPRLVISVLIQILCSYSTLPLYAIVTQMGSSFKKAIFDENVQEGLVGWAQQVKKRKGMRVMNRESGSTSTLQSGNGTSVGIPLQNLVIPKDHLMEEGKAEIVEEKTFLKDPA
ncbi:MLO-like protein 1 [Phoenix dactylifera]|uniref:MLO-like protein n=1 Tax=Phoenix dactylifera TaxID=42345 RepID=A0A8B9ARZ4_PHODC|nr:MLO-like protein 1 [Phoenix dactylifera]